MLRTTRVLVPLVATLLLGATGAARAGAQVGVGFFYDGLAPYGQWMVHARFGNVWRPSGVEAGWRPYTHGHWRHDGGQRLWVSDYPWGWAPFHYGRWFQDPAYGWLWVPGTVWAPAWVAWRTGGGYVGWAPLPPEVGDADGEFDGGSLDDGYAADGYWGGAPAWSFVVEAAFWSPGLRVAIVPAYRNDYCIRSTVNVTHYEVVNHRPFDRSFDEHDRGRGDGHWAPRPGWRDAMDWHRSDDGRRNIQPVRRIEPERPAWNGGTGWRAPERPIQDERPARHPEPGNGDWHPRGTPAPPAAPAWRSRPGLPETRPWHPVEALRAPAPGRPAGRPASGGPAVGPARHADHGRHFE